MKRHHVTVLSVDEAAQALDCSPQTIRRLLHTGRLSGRKIGREWVVWQTEEGTASGHGSPQARERSPAALTPTTATLRTRLREVGETLIAVGNRIASARRGRGKLFLTWRTPHSLRVTFAIGRTSPTKGWSPHALGVDLPFWVEERPHWRQVLPLLQRYERLRTWCAPQLLRVAGVAEVVLTELDRLDTALHEFGATHAAQEQDTPRKT